MTTVNYRDIDGYNNKVNFRKGCFFAIVPNYRMGRQIYTSANLKGLKSIVNRFYRDRINFVIINSFKIIILDRSV